MLYFCEGVRPCMRAYRLTLIELLVVFGIILILSSVLLPVIQNALGKARAVACMSNLKQIGEAADEYTESYDGITMPGDFDGISSFGHWANYLFEMDVLNDERSYLCPSQTDEDSFNPRGGTNEITEASYIMNLMPRGNAATVDWHGFYMKKGGPLQGWGRVTASLVRKPDVADPSQAFHILDVASGGIHWNHRGVNKSSRSDWGVPLAPPVGSVRWVGYHHSDGFNSLFGDMHVEPMRQSRGENWVVKRR